MPDIASRRGWSHYLLLPRTVYVQTCEACVAVFIGPPAGFVCEADAPGMFLCPCLRSWVCEGSSSSRRQWGKDFLEHVQGVWNPVPTGDRACFQVHQDQGCQRSGIEEADFDPPPQRVVVPVLHEP